MIHKIIIDHPIIDLHAHLRDVVSFHTKFALEAGIDTIVFMPNTNPCLDNLKEIQKYLKQKHFVKMIPTSAITIGREGRQLVDIERIENHVLGFSDDGNCLMDMKLVEDALKKNVLLLVHLEPEVEMTKKYLSLLKKTGGKLHIQHVSRKETVDLIREAKKHGLKFTCETCPHYFTYHNEVEDKPVGPPLGNYEDVLAIRKGLADDTIDIIASDYAPIPRPKGTGFASYLSFVPLCYGLVLDDTLTPKQLKEKIYLNPLKIIRENYPKFKEEKWMIN